MQEAKEGHTAYTLVVNTTSLPLYLDPFKKHISQTVTISRFSTAVPNHLIHVPAPPAVSKTVSLLRDIRESFYTSSKSVPASPGSRLSASTVFLGILRIYTFWYTVTTGIKTLSV